MVIFKKLTCQNCDLEITVSKTKEGVNADVGYRKRLPDKFVDQVLEMLPLRPWPKGIHKEIAEQLGVSNNAVSSAIAKLLDEGRIPKETDSGGLNATGAKVMQKGDQSNPVSIFFILKWA